MECTCNSSGASLVTYTVIDWPTLAFTTAFVGVTWPLAIVIFSSGAAAGCGEPAAVDVATDVEPVAGWLDELDVLVLDDPPQATSPAINAADVTATSPPGIRISIRLSSIRALVLVTYSRPIPNQLSR